MDPRSPRNRSVRCVTVGHRRERIRIRDVVAGMSSLATDNLIPLSLSEQLDAMLSGWAVLIVEGPAAPVRGFVEITAMYRR